jgi:shikimate kinase
MSVVMDESQAAPIFLIGYRATGKSLVARELAARLSRSWADSDDVIEQRAGKSIAQIFADDGEPAFRELETEAVAALARETGCVVALGGGAVLREENRRAIRQAAAVVWLKASVDTILQRMAADHTTTSRRPNLTIEGGRAEVEELLVVRTPLYRECATLAVDTDLKTASQVADEIVAQLSLER